MASWTLSWAVTIGILAVLVHQLGVFDRPPFHDASVPNLYAVVASCNDASFGRHIPLLLNTTLSFVSDELSNGKERLETAAESYNVPATTKRVSVGLYFDNPSETPNPRWAIGWALQAESLEALQKEVAAAKKEEEKKECGTLRVVLIPAGVYRQGRIPWRNFLTPMIAPLLHWGRAFANLKEGHDAAIAMEVYVTSHHGDDEQEKYEYIDYVVLADLDAMENIIQDAFPSKQEEPQQEGTLSQKEEMPVEEIIVDE